MDTGRADYNAVFKVSSFGPDEPTFVLRPSDPNAAKAVRAWVAFSAMEGVPPALLESALGQADRIDKWPVKKLPGDDHLQAHQRQQLEYEYSRRLWDSGDGAPWRMAELRGHIPDHPPELMRQLAREQQAAASLYVAKAAGFYAEAGSRRPDGETRTAAWFENQRLQADAAANRAAYFLAIATCLQQAATLLEHAGAPAEAVG